MSFAPLPHLRHRQSAKLCDKPRSDRPSWLPEASPSQNISKPSILSTGICQDLQDLPGSIVLMILMVALNRGSIADSNRHMVCPHQHQKNRRLFHEFDQGTTRVGAIGVKENIQANYFPIYIDIYSSPLPITKPPKKNTKTRVPVKFWEISDCPI